jgi:hypothetical protein
MIELRSQEACPRRDAEHFDLKHEQHRRESFILRDKEAKAGHH